MHIGGGRKGGGLCLYIRLQSQGWFSRRGDTRRRNFGLCKERACFFLRWEFQLECQLASSRLCYRANTHAAESLNPSVFSVCCLRRYSVCRSPKQHTTLRLWSARSPSSRAFGELYTVCSWLPSQLGGFPAFLCQVWHYRDLCDCCRVCIFWEQRHNSFQPAFVHGFPMLQFKVSTQAAAISHTCRSFSFVTIV